MEVKEEGREKDSSDDEETQGNGGKLQSLPDDSCDMDSMKAVFESNDPGLWPVNLKDMEIFVRYLAKRDKDQEMPNDSEAKPFPEYLKYTKVANGREKFRRDWAT